MSRRNCNSCGRLHPSPVLAKKCCSAVVKEITKMAGVSTAVIDDAAGMVYFYGNILYEENHKPLEECQPYVALPLFDGVKHGDAASRPVAPTAGQVYFDTDLNKPIWYNGTDWVDATGTGV